MTLGEREKWWEHLEVSSNTNHRERLFDGDPTTRWQTLHYSSGGHWIKMFMKQDLIVK